MSSQRFYQKHDEIEMRFYQMPKSLFNNPKYKGLSLASKAMYAILRDRQDLSIKNGWYDESGYIYSIYSIDELAELIEMDRKSVMRYKKELVSYGLLIDKRKGQGKANRLYVLKPEITESSLKSQNGTSTSGVKGLQEVQNKASNDTDLIDTDLNDDDDDIEQVFKKLVEKHQFSKDMAQSIIQALPRSLQEYKTKAMHRTFIKTVPRTRNRTINNVPNWFATTLENETYLLEQEEIEEREIKQMNEKYGMSKI